jgi:hypothetical protein
MLIAVYILFISVKGMMRSEAGQVISHILHCQKRSYLVDVVFGVLLCWQLASIHSSLILNQKYTYNDKRVGLYNQHTW